MHLLHQLQASAARQPATTHTSTWPEPCYRHPTDSQGAAYPITCTSDQCTQLLVKGPIQAVIPQCHNTVMALALDLLNFTGVLFKSFPVA